MNPSLAIKLKNIGVCYRVYSEKVFSLKESSISTLKKLGGIAQGKEWNPGYRELWAIQNIDLEIPKGVSLGLTGRNGSGKSTTLKVISGVLHPTTGEMWVRGRIAALVELGAGFEPELTGRENIYFAASVAGLSRKETDKKIDRIIEFSELGQFIDLPVKNYSSGMYARLGFAVTTDVDPDVLIVDEILGVGDGPFQEKCRHRMETFKKKGKTILFVSHDPRATQAFCDETILMENGHIVQEVSRTSGLGNTWGET
jgi:ABC-type polysaccharide/polyol phosphate transport system ATPase subunit